MYLRHIDKILYITDYGHSYISAAMNRYEIYILWTLKNKYRNLADYLKSWSLVMDNREQYLNFHLSWFFQ